MDAMMNFQIIIDPPTKSNTPLQTMECNEDGT